jgi:hypothetical protein
MKKFVRTPLKNFKVNFCQFFCLICSINLFEPLDTQGFTKAVLDANPQANYASLSIMPRAYFLTATYKF